MSDNAGMSKIQAFAIYSLLSQMTNYENCTAPDSSSGKRCFLKVLIVLQLMLPADSEFQLSITVIRS